MKGTDLTQEQIDSAEQFIKDRFESYTRQQPEPETHVSLEFGVLVRVVAWYGALRYEAGALGINSLEDPGETIIAKPKFSIVP